MNRTSFQFLFRIKVILGWSYNVYLGLEEIPELRESEELVEVNLSHNSISIISNTLPPSIKSLNLQNNRIAFVGNIDESLPALKALNLSSNRLISIERLRYCARLKYLNLANNFIGDDQAPHVLQFKVRQMLEASFG